MLRLYKNLKAPICAEDILPRLHSGLQVKYDNSVYKVIGYLYDRERVILRNSNKPNCELIVDIDDVRPRLRPMDSMTSQEKERYQELLDGVANQTTGVWEVTEWLNNNLFDYKDLIGKGLAEEL